MTMPAADQQNKWIEEGGQKSPFYKGEHSPEHQEPVFALWGSVPHVLQETTWEEIRTPLGRVTSIHEISQDETIYPRHGWLSEQVENKFWEWVEVTKEELPVDAKKTPTIRYFEKRWMPCSKPIAKDPWDVLGVLVFRVFPVDLAIIYRTDPAVFNFILNAFHGRGCENYEQIRKILRNIEDDSAVLRIALLGLFVATEMMKYCKKMPKYADTECSDQRWDEDAILDYKNNLEETRRNIEEFVMEDISKFKNFSYPQEYFEKYCGDRKYLERPAERLRPEFLLRTWRKQEQAKILDPFFLAYKSNSGIVLSHKFCQRSIQKRWSENSRQRLPLPCYTTSVKYGLHGVVHLLYVGLFINVLVRKPSRIEFSKTENGTNITDYHSLSAALEKDYSIPDAVGMHWKEILIFMFQLSHLLDILTKWMYTRLDWSKSIDTVDILYNGVNLINFIISIMSAFRVTCITRFPSSQTLFAVLFSIGDFLYLASFILAAIILIRFTGKFKLFGSILRILQKSFWMCFRYMLVFAALWIIYATVYLHVSDKRESTNYVLWMMLQNGVFEIFGEVTKDKDTAGIIDGCFNSSLEDTGSFDVPTVRCFVRRMLVPVVLFCYMLLSSVMLVNLLTAMLSQAYEEMQNKSELQWKCDNYHLLIKCEAMSELPPPFTLLVYAVRAVEFLVYSCCFPLRKLIGCIVRSCCSASCKSCCFARPITYQPITRRWSRLYQVFRKYDPDVKDKQADVELGGIGNA